MRYFECFSDEEIQWIHHTTLRVLEWENPDRLRETALTRGRRPGAGTLYVEVTNRVRLFL